MELKEVDPKTVNDVMFQRIGMDVQILSKSEGFSSKELPARGLAVSNRFGYTLFAHKRGFTVAKTADLLILADKVKAKSSGTKTAQETGVATVTVPDIRILALSSDELTVGVCAGGNVMFHELATLVHKADTRPFEVRRVDSGDDAYAKYFSWNPSNSESYLLLTSQGKLLLGHIGSTPECKVEKGVVAASWSSDGQHIAHVADNRQMSICNSNFAKKFEIELPGRLLDEDDDSDLHVDAIRWMRPDSIVVGYVRVNSEGEEDEYPLFALSSTNGNLAQEGSKVVGLVFYRLFPSIDSFVIPSGSGPYMLAEYFKPWEIVVAASRKSIDDHVVLMSWLPEDGIEAMYSLELGNELWVPRIELQDNGEDNAILGLAIDRTTTQIRLPDPRDETGEAILPAYPVLICLTLEGKLSFFTFGRLDGKWQLPELVKSPSDVPDAKRSGPQASLQAPKTQEATKAVVPFSPTVVKVEQATSVTPSSEKPIERGGVVPFSPTVVKVDQAKDVTASSEKSIQSLTSYKTEEKQEKPKQPTGPSTRITGNGDKISLFEQLTRPSATLPQVIQGDKHYESPRLGLKSISQDVPKSINEPSSAPAPGFRGMDLKGSANVANFQSLFQPFDDGSKSRPSPPNISSQQTQRVSQPPAISSSFSIASGAPVKSFQVGPSATPTTILGSRGKGPDATSTFTSSSTVKIPTTVAKLITNQRGADRFSTGTQPRVFQDQQLHRRPPAVTDMEATFISELEKVRRMADEVDQLMLYIEGRRQKDTYESLTAFTKHSLEALEQGIYNLSEECKAFRRNFNQVKQDIEDLRDEGIRVDAWRIHAQSLMEQKSDSRHQELWTHQKLHPELEMKRKRVLRADQELKLGIAELEGHLHNLELKQWQQNNTRRRLSRQIRPPGQFSSLQHLYNTVNTQMAVAEQLANSLTQQMETLNIKWSPAVKDSKATTATILKSVGANYGADQSGIPRQCLSYPPMTKGMSNPAAQVPEPSIQEVTRRRRDSMDSAWVNRGAPTTTIKRVVRTRPSQIYTPVSSRQGVFTSLEASQPRQVQSMQNTRVGRTPLVPSFGVPAQVPPSSAPQWSSLGPEPLQMRPGSAFPFGDTSATRLVPDIPAANNSSKESVFKWANNIQTVIPQGTANVPLRTAVSSSQPFAATSNGARPSLFGKPVIVPSTKPTADDTEVQHLASAGGAFQLTSRNSSSRVGTMEMGERLGFLSPSDNQFERLGDSSATASAPPMERVRPPSVSSHTPVSIGSLPSPQKPLRKESEETNLSRLPLANQQTLSSVSQGIQVRPFDIAGPGISPLAANMSASVPFSWGTALKPAPLVQPAVSKPADMSVSVLKAVDAPKSVTTKPVEPPVSVSKPVEAPKSVLKPVEVSISTSKAPSTVLEAPVSVAKPAERPVTIPKPLEAPLSASKPVEAPRSATKPVEAPISESKPVETPEGKDSFTSMNLNLGTVSDGLSVTPFISGTAQAITTPNVPVPTQSPGSPFTSSSSASFMTTASQITSASPFGQSSLWQPMAQPSQQQFAFPGSSSTATVSSSPVESNEEDMEEEATTTSGLGTGFGGFGGLGLGSGSAAQTQKANPFGGSSPFGASQPYQLAPPADGQLFRPAAFSLPAAQSSPQQAAGSSPFGSGFGSPGFSQTNLFSEAGKGFGSSPQAQSGFGQRAQLGPGQQALGSALGAFGQTRQVGLGTPFGSGMGSAPGGGFANAPGGGFANASPGGGFAGAAAGGGFSGAAMGGGFAAAAAAAAPGGGFQGGGFAGLGGGGFQAFSGNQGTPPVFGGGVPPAQTSLFTQMRK